MYFASWFTLSIDFIMQLIHSFKLLSYIVLDQIANSIDGADYKWSKPVARWRKVHQFVKQSSSNMKKRFTNLWVQLLVLQIFGFSTFSNCPVLRTNNFNFDCVVIFTYNICLIQNTTLIICLILLPCFFSYKVNHVLQFSIIRMCFLVIIWLHCFLL